MITQLIYLRGHFYLRLSPFAKWQKYVCEEPVVKSHFLLLISVVLSVCLFYHFNIDFFLDSLMVRWSPGHHGFQCIFFALPWHRGRMVVYTISGVAITLLIYFRDKCICYMLKQRKLFVFRWWSACRLYANARG